MQAQKGDRVSVRYTGRLDSDEVFDTNEQDGAPPLVFEVGGDEVLEGFSRAVEGLAQGESRRFRLAPEDAYGAWDEALLVRVARGAIGDEALEVGLEVDVEDADGNVAPARVVEMDEQTVSLDFNHPLAGQSLTFDVRVEAIDRPSTSAAA